MGMLVYNAEIGEIVGDKNQLAEQLLPDFEALVGAYDTKQVERAQDSYQRYQVEVLHVWGRERDDAVVDVRNVGL